MKIKVCGMRTKENITSLLSIKPDFIGFIFYDKSTRFVSEFPKVDIPKSISKIGVFVNEKIVEIVRKVKVYQLDGIQLHGTETSAYCEELNAELRSKGFYEKKIIKAFSVDNFFDFNSTKSYENFCDYFLFDAKGKDFGGNGIQFNWKLIRNYTGNKPFLLSGGIGSNDLAQLKMFISEKESELCIGVDVNSQFEDSPGVKNIVKLEKFKKSLV